MGEVSWKVAVMSNHKGISHRKALHCPNIYIGTLNAKGNTPSQSVFHCFLVQRGNFSGCSMEFKVSLKQSSPLDLESITFLELWLPSFHHGGLSVPWISWRVGG